jgi:hypothetical protein
MTCQQLQARLTASPYVLLSRLQEIWTLNLVLRVSAFFALAFDCNSRRRILIPSPDFSRDSEKHTDFPRNAGKQFPHGNTNYTFFIKNVYNSSLMMRG